MRRWILVAAIPFVIMVCALPFLVVAKWDGRFTLTVHVEAAPNVDLESIAYLECWRGDVAEALTEHCDAEVETFKPPYKKAGSTHEVSLHSSGDYGAFGLIDTYQNPEFVVIQYRLIGHATETVSRKMIPVPVGRGDRAVTVTLP